LVVGLGNPIMGDDGVGIHVLRQLMQRTRPRADLEFKQLSVGGIKLVEEILGYRIVFVIDSIESGDTVGRIREFSPEQFNNTYHESAPHAVNFITALELYKKLEPTRVPERIRIFTIDIKNEFEFKETLTPPIQEAASRLTEILADEIKSAHGQSCEPKRQTFQPDKD
jgi:hydrogenase maturation protease